MAYLMADPDLFFAHCRAIYAVRRLRSVEIVRCHGYSLAVTVKNVSHARFRLDFSIVDFLTRLGQTSISWYGTSQGCLSRASARECLELMSLLDLQYVPAPRGFRLSYWSSLRTRLQTHATKHGSHTRAKLPWVPGK